MKHTVRSNMAGTLLEMLVKPGDAVREGQDVAMIESMKMHLSIQSDRSGTVVETKVNPGDFVNDGDALMEIEV
ncbi:MAG: biotin/lipoyl-containing protein [Planctomycetota bacterium]